MLRAVQTTPPMMRAATIPLVPLKPTATMMTEATMSVIKVMPLTGFVPTMAMAFAATVVKRKVMTLTTRMATMLKTQFPPITSKWKKRKVSTRARMMPKVMNRIGRSFCVRGASICSTSFLPLSSLPASETASTIMRQLFTMPMMPAIAMPPMPMLFAYLKMTSGEASAAVTPSCTSSDGKKRAMQGTMTHHTSAEPQQMMKAYLSPTM